MNGENKSHYGQFVSFATFRATLGYSIRVRVTLTPDPILH